MSWITENLNKYFLEFLQAVFDFFSSSLIKMFGLGVKIAQTSNVADTAKITSGIAVGFISVYVLKEVLSTYIMETDGDPDSDPIQLIVRGTEAIAAVSCQSWVFNYLLKFSQALTEDITGDGIQIETFTNNFERALDKLGSSTINPVVVVLFLIFILGMVFMLCFKAVLRGVELAICRILFPIFSIDLCTTSRERFHSFLSTYMVTFLGYIIQLFCFEMGVAKVISALAYTTFDNYIQAIAWMWFALKTPKWLDKFAYSSGLKNTAGGAVRTVFQMRNLVKVAA